MLKTGVAFKAWITIVFFSTEEHYDAYCCQMDLERRIIYTFSRLGFLIFVIAHTQKQQ